IDWCNSQLRLLLLADHLPGNDIRVVLHRGDEYLVAWFQILASVGLSDEVDRLCRAANENDFATVLRPKKFLGGPAGVFVLIRRSLRKGVHPTMNIGVVALVVVRDRVYHLARLLRGRGIIQVHQRMTMHLLMKDREVRANALDVVVVHLRLGEIWKLGDCHHPTSSTFLSPVPTPACLECSRNGSRCS